MQKPTVSPAERALPEGPNRFTRWFRRSPVIAESAWIQGSDQAEDADSQFNAAERLAQGNGVVQDSALAAEWYLKAAAQGHSQAQFSLGMMYGQGQGVVRSEAQALVWLGRAAELGHAAAQYHLGVRLYRTSKAVKPADSAECCIEACKWLQLAVAQGHRAADSAREFVTLVMSREQVDEAGRRAQAFAPRA